MGNSSDRKGFNFYRSYFDVYSQLSSDADKLSFVDALLKKQFLGVDPDDLKGMAKFAYISQQHSIDQQVKGWEDKTGRTLNHPPYQGGTQGGRQGGTQGGSSTPWQQEEEKGQEKEKEKGQHVSLSAQPKLIDPWPTFDDFWDLYDKKVDRKSCEPKWAKLKQSEKEKIMGHVQLYVTVEQPDKQYRKHPGTYLNNRSWENEIIQKRNYEQKRTSTGIPAGKADFENQSFD